MALTEIEPDNTPDSPDSSGLSDGRDDGRPRPILKEVGAIYLAAIALILVCVLIAGAVPFVSQNLYALVAAVFVGVPYFWLSRKNADFDRFGLTWDRAGRGALWGLVLAALTLGPFAVGYWWWETRVQERHFEFSADNLYQWPVDIDGRPAQWGESSGVWVWADGPTLHVGMRADEEPVEVELEAGRPFEPQVFGRVDVRPSAEAKEQRILVEPGRPRARAVIGRASGRSPPRSLRIEARHPETGQPVTIHQGATAAEAGSSLELSRGLSWLLLWALTQLVFIALPEEFFYRGYLQTRLADALRAWRRRRGRDPEGRRPLGVSAQNFLTSVLFAVGHVVIPIGGVFVATRAAVFFPSLVFGWLRERTGTIAAPVVYHAAANLMVLASAPHFF